jgi:hypothetical protein
MDAANYCYPENWRGVLSLSRLVVVPGVPKNACSFLIRHSMRLIDRERWPCLLSYADEWQGHEGTIYRAAGWVEMGWTVPVPQYVRKADGRVMGRKKGSSPTMTHEDMLRQGCERVGFFRKKRFVHIVGEGKKK